MDTYSSGEDLIIKTRKPYTITKQRERWTEEEHNRFLEALKLYGRAWQRIEEHIGTKTAVQIRSHAQKFFSKLEKEAMAKGIPIGQTLDIDIPPPRPKRKPNTPYPRKTGSSPIAAHLGEKNGKNFNSVALPHVNRVLGLEKELLREKAKGDEGKTNFKENQNDNCSEVFTHLPENHDSSVSSVIKNGTKAEASRNSCSSREFTPSLNKRNSLVNGNATDESYVTIELEGNQKLDRPDVRKTVQENGSVEASKFRDSGPFHEKVVLGKEPNDLTNALPADEMQTMQNYPRHVPVHVLDGRMGPSVQAHVSEMTFQDSLFQPMGENHTHLNVYLHPAASTTTEHQSTVLDSSIHGPFPVFPPPFTSSPHNQDDCRSFRHISTFSNLLVSTLLQNPAAHAAASYAATFWPYANVENSADSPTSAQGGLLSGQMNSSPSMTAIAAATVAAATAWWAAHGLLPLCALHAAFNCPPPPATAIPSMQTGQVPATKMDIGKIADNPPFQDQQMEPVDFEPLQAQHSVSKSPASSSSDSEESRNPKVISAGSKVIDHEKTATAPEAHDSTKTKTRKQLNRSSCGSNTPSSSEVETNALEKDEKGKEEQKGADPNHTPAEPSGRRSRSGSSTSDSWKEVSEEGRLAFQALFSRQVLPQSFSLPHDLMCKAQQKDNAEDGEEISNIKDENASRFDISNKTRSSSSGHEEVEKNITSENKEEGLLTIGLGIVKLKARRTGFKPYKRCSMQAKEHKLVTTYTQGDEKGPKRMRLEGEASTVHF
ncbi:hypothetical protein K2173_005072 [Erythroxylum novogranatense]|uniref:LHY n=1 Tax=Erythroxylum novogranatense TaxID=1862640 RepID=A0AAV8UBY4_9ROSI|nr:hypothetical protein K2173_005072 [Erythroxylum novogranatense]